MQHWDINALDLDAHQPQVLRSDEETRAIILLLPAGEELQEHQVHERAYVVVVAGEVQIASAAGETVSGGPGLTVHFEPGERHTVRARSTARLMLLLSPWPGVGHPSHTD
jgi:quercetin dioxygenase-like cupin family protein